NGLISPLAFGETGVKGRIHNVLKYKKPAVWVSAAAIAAVIVAALLLLPNAARDANTIAATVTENITLEYSDESGVYTEIYLKKTTDGSVTLLTEDGAEIITAEDVIPLPYVYAVKTNGKYDLLDKTSYTKTSSVAYDEIYCQKYPDGRLATSVMKGRAGQYWGLISAQGASLTNPQTQPFEDIQLNTYEEVWPIIAVIQAGRYGAIDYNGQRVIEAGFDYLAMDVYNVPNTVFVLDRGAWGALKLDQNLVVPGIDYSLTPPAGIIQNAAIFAQAAADNTRLALFDLAIQYRFDYVPFFTEGNAPPSSSEYLNYAFAMNLDNWGDAKGTMSKTYVEDVIQTHFKVINIVHEAPIRGWNFDGLNYTAVAGEMKEKPVYVLNDLRVRARVIEGEPVVYEATMTYCGLAIGKRASDEDMIRIREEIMNGNYSSLSSLQHESFMYSLNDNGEPVFIAHTLIDDEEL
ncbi:MAG: hypothetical protein LBT32_06185, partial [Peptococcaceae bacterium]|nr:hypothetical protein [Peptococcaceae bacterium]